MSCFALTLRHESWPIYTLMIKGYNLNSIMNHKPSFRNGWLSNDFSYVMYYIFVVQCIWMISKLITKSQPRLSLGLTKRHAILCTQVCCVWRKKFRTSSCVKLIFAVCNNDSDNLRCFASLPPTSQSTKVDCVVFEQPLWLFSLTKSTHTLLSIHCYCR